MKLLPKYTHIIREGRLYEPLHILPVSLPIGKDSPFLSGLLRKMSLWGGANLAESLKMAGTAGKCHWDWLALGHQPKGLGFLELTSIPEVCGGVERNTIQRYSNCEYPRIQLCLLLSLTH